MPIWKVSQSEESAALVALASPQPSSISWHHRADAVLKPCEHEAQIAPPPEQRAMERSRIDPALRALPGATIARIKARVIPRERHNIDNDLDESPESSGVAVLERVVGSFTFPVSSVPFGEAAGMPAVKPAVVSAATGQGEEAQLAQAALAHAQQLAEPFRPAAPADSASVGADSGCGSSVGSASSKRKTATVPESHCSAQSRGSSSSSDEFSAERSEDSASVRSAGETVAAGAGPGVAVKKARADTAAALEPVTLDGTPIKRRRTKIPLSSVEILQDWFSAHVSNPYPTDEEKAALMAKAKLDAVQLVNWFTNTRKRFWYQHPTDRNQNRLCAVRVEKGAAAPPDESAASGANGKVSGGSSVASAGSAGSSGSSSGKRAKVKAKKRTSVKEDEDEELEEEEDDQEQKQT